MLLFFKFLIRFIKEISYYRKCYDWSKPFWDMQAKTVSKHYNAKGKYRIHCSILQVLVLLDILYVAYSKLPHNQSANAISYQYQRYGKSESKSSKNAIYGKCCIYNLKIKYLAYV